MVWAPPPNSTKVKPYLPVNIHHPQRSLFTTRSGSSYEDGNFRIGAYDESNLSTKPTDRGRAALADAFENLKEVNQN